MEKPVLHIKSECPALLTAGGRTAGEISASKPCHIAAEKKEILFLYAAPLVKTRSEAVKLLPAAVKLVISGGVPQPQEGLLITGFPGGHFEILIKCEAVYSYSPALAVEQAEFTHAHTRHTATLFKDALNQVVCEGDGRLFHHVLPDGYLHRSLTAESAGGAAVVKISGALQSGGEYFGVIVYSGGEYRLDVNLICERLEFEGEEFQALIPLGDIARRGAVLTYRQSGGGYELKESYLVYLAAAAQKPANPALLPFALFEAVKCGDTAEARALLHGDLNAALGTGGALADFFSGYESIGENLCFPEKGGLLLYGREENNYRPGAVLRVTRSDGLISDIEID